MQMESKDHDPLVDAIVAGKTSLKCLSGNKIAQLCTTKDCTVNAIICDDEQCQQCSLHQLCQSLKVKPISKLLQKMCQHKITFIEKIGQMRQEILKKTIDQKRNKLENDLKINIISQHRDIFEKIYLCQNAQLEHSSYDELNNRIKIAFTQAENADKDLLIYFEDEGNSIIRQFAKIEDQIFKQYNISCSGIRFISKEQEKDSMASSVINEKNQSDQILEELFPLKKPYKELFKENNHLLKLMQTLENQHTEEINKLSQTIKSLTKQKETKINQINNYYEPQIKKLKENNQQLYNQRRCSDAQRQKQLSIARNQKIVVQRAFAQFKKQNAYKLAQMENVYRSQKNAYEMLKGFKQNQNSQFMISTSKIISKENLEWRKLLYDALQKPRRLSLIFRASEYQFKAQKFHKQCEGARYTLTVILTEHNDVIAGFTSAVWGPYVKDQDIDYGNPSYSREQEPKNFLISLNHKIKMTYNQRSSAIGSTSCHGPIFGRKDLIITDECNLNRKSSSSCPDKYCNESKKWSDSNKQIQYQFPMGHFKVLQYEVFNVYWS